MADGPAHQQYRCKTSMSSRRQRGLQFCSDLSDTVLLNPPKYNTLRHSAQFLPHPFSESRPTHFGAVDLESVFNDTFAELGCELRGGADEPLYMPRARPGAPDLIHYTRDYFASALHEVAHWCIAGDERRRRVDYGYWYAPDGRTAAQQRAFEQVEIRPQALEWLFNLCCGHRFLVSADNLEAGLGASECFVAAVSAQARAYVRALRGEGSIPVRGRCFALALGRFYGRPLPREDEVVLPS